MYKLKPPCPSLLIIVDEDAIFAAIREKRPASIALNGPDGILPQVQQAAAHASEKFGIPAYVIADATWGSCDLNTRGARALGAGLLFNIGHTIGAPMWEDDVIMVDAYDDASFDKVARKACKALAGKTVSLVTDSQHLLQIDPVKKIFADAGIATRVGRGRGQLNDGQVFGCEFYPAKEAAAEADANAFLGQSNFHAAGLALSTGLPTYVLDPYFNEVREVSEFAKKMQKKATLAVYRAAEAQTFGIIVGLRDGQMSKTAALLFKKELEKEGKTVQLLAMTDITNDRLRNLGGIDAFIQVACPRISTDNEFGMPVLSTPQASALLQVLRGKEPGSYLQAPHWL